MPDVTDPPPAAVQQEIDTLSGLLDREVPAKSADNLLIATWNIRCFGGLTKKWEAGSGDSPKRDWHALRLIAEVVSRFDVIAIQEVKSELTAIRELIRVLGPDNWGVILTDVTYGNAGNDERFAFVYDRRRLQQDGLACELVVSEEGPWKLSDISFREQFARTPYAVAFKNHKASFVLVTLHILYGTNAEDRLPEILTIAEMLGYWAKRRPDSVWSTDFIALGDFNIEGREDAEGQDAVLLNAFTSSGLRPASWLRDAPRTIFASGANHYYDQVAWFHNSVGSALSFPDRAGGFVDFTTACYPGMSTTALSWRVSDHYPLWVEFGV